MGRRASHRAWRYIGGIVCLTVIASACVATPGSSTTTTTEPQADQEIEALLADPAFVAQFGDTEEERAQIVADLRKYVDSWGEWSLDEGQLAAWAKEKQEADRAVEAENEREQARLAQEAERERARLDAQESGPQVDDLLATQTDGSENYDYSTDARHWASVAGFADTQEQLRVRHDATAQRVDRLVTELTATGQLAELDKDDGYVPPQGKDDPLFTAIWLEAKRERLAPIEPEGACKNRVGGRAAPTDPNLRPGTIYSPYQNAFADSDATPTYLGQLKTVLINGQRNLVVEGHLGNLDVAGIWSWVTIPEWAQARITVHTANNVATDHDGFGPFTQLAIPGTPVQSGQIEVLCYSDDYGLATGQPLRRAMFRAYIPLSNAEYDLTDSVFQLRATVSDIPSSWANPPLAFFGSDMRTVHLGQQPLGYNSTFTNGGGFGVTASSGVIADQNGVAGDDLESTLRPPVSSAITTALSGLDGTSAWVLGKKKSNSSWGWFGFHINNSNPTTPNVDIDWNQTSAGGQPDDEFRLRGSVSMNDWLIEGYTSLPWAAAGIIPCYFRMKVDWSASIYASVDINDTARTILVPDLQFGSVNVSVHNMYAQTLPLGCNSLYLFKFVDSWMDKLNSKLPGINQQLATQIQATPNITNVAPSSIPIGGGQTMNATFSGWNDTCQPYGCNGSGAGDMAMSWAGLEASGDLKFSDTKPVAAVRRFPASYSPRTASTVNDRIRLHFGPQNETTDFSAYISPSLLNQMLRVLAEQGRLDVGVDPANPIVARSAPVFMSTPIAADKPLGLFVPHLELDPAGPNLFAIDAFAAIGVGFDPGTRKLVPSTLSPSDPGLGIGIWTLNCENALWATCEGIPTIASNVLNWAGNTLLNPLLQSSVGQVKIPQTSNFSLSGLQIVNEDGNLGLRASVGAAELRAWGNLDANTYGFDTFWEGLPGTGPVTYQWTIKDGITGAVLHTETSTHHQLYGFPTSALHVVDLPLVTQDYRKVTATITASRGGVSRTATHTMDLWS